ncbi:MAG TPA: phosphatase PAP2 family protein [Deinococcales bacterium]|nr:phosphatase PAP2 family protein [Deinococcales bacterium]
MIAAPVRALLGWLERRTSIAAAFWGTLLGGLALVLALLAGVAAIVDVVKEGGSQDLDEAVIRWVAANRDETVTGAALAVTHVGDFWPTVVVLSSGFWFMVGRRRWLSAIAILVAVAGGFLLNVLLKELFQRPRPLAEYRLLEPLGFSFPSGHAMVSASMYAVLVYLLVRGARPATWRRALQALMALLIPAIAASRVYLGVHYPTDVAAGFLAGFSWALVILTALELARHWRGRRDPEAPPTEEATTPTRTAGMVPDAGEQAS